MFLVSLEWRFRLAKTLAGILSGPMMANNQNRPNSLRYIA
jgi:hypothetical protein